MLCEGDGQSSGNPNTMALDASGCENVSEATQQAAIPKMDADNLLISQPLQANPFAKQTV